jgi:NAD-dependent deacetylase
MMTMQLTEKAISLIRKSDRIVALSGAGISTEAGIPDFRGAGGLWESNDLVEQLSASGFHRDPETFYRSSIRLFTAMSAAKPTATHQLLALLENMGKLRAVITQNIDGLHQAAGSGKVFEIHGTCRTGHCPKCSASFEMGNFYSEIEKGQLKVPLCPACRISIKPDIVLFEEALPEDAWNNSVEAAQQCDLMMVFGSSLVVFPAAELPMIALESGARLLIVNFESTCYDHMAAVAIQTKLGDFAKYALAAFM